MGYTHYWDRRRILPVGPFRAAVADCQKLCQSLPIPLGDAVGRHQPTFSNAEVCFNGRADGPDGDRSYETFHVLRVQPLRHHGDQGHDGWWFSFCKTARLSYDLCVQCCLLILSHHLGNTLFLVSSDGNSEDWNNARQACQRVLGYGTDWKCDGLSVPPPVPPPPVEQPVA
jgi:hypothetical protein